MPPGAVSRVRSCGPGIPRTALSRGHCVTLPLLLPPQGDHRLGGRGVAWGATADRATGMRECLKLHRKASCPRSASRQGEPAEPDCVTCRSSRQGRGSPPHADERRELRGIR
jgi:hypothetical protein